MRLIHFHGLNCKDSAVVNIAANLELSYENAFSSLWSETDFVYNDEYDIFLSGKLYRGFEKIGLIFEPILVTNAGCTKSHGKNHSSRSNILKTDYSKRDYSKRDYSETDCSKTDYSKTDYSERDYSERDYSDFFRQEFSDGEFFVVGMDAFDIPWHTIYRNFHDNHFFFAQKQGEHLVCHDPIFNKTDISLKTETVFGNAFDISHVYSRNKNDCLQGQFADNNKEYNIPNKSTVIEKETDLLFEARQIIENQQKLRNIFASLYSDRQEDPKHLNTLIKQTTVLINNRNLFGRYLNSISTSGLSILSTYNHDCPFFEKAFYDGWEAIKMGLIKTKIKKENTAVVKQTVALLNKLLDKEIQLAYFIANITKQGGKDFF